MQFFKDPHYDFIRWRYHAVAISMLLILIGAGFFFTRGINLAIDFAGGANIVLKFREQPPIDELRGTVRDATIQRYGQVEDNSVLIRLPKLETERDYAGETVGSLHQSLNEGAAEGALDLNYAGSEAIAELLISENPDKLPEGPETDATYHEIADAIIAHRSELGLFHQFSEVAEAEGVTPAAAALLQERTFLGRFNVLSQETVGPQVGRELQRKAFLAILLSTLAMGTYIAIRFDLKFGVAAVLCLVHDVLLALAFQAVTGIEFSLLAVAAYLTIVGYSINDTVVIYDRVRENVKRVRVKMGFGDVLNLSMNQTLSRTILTSGSTLIVLVCLIIWGGEVINGFAWLLFVGIIVGTYSTLTVVPTIALLWNRYLAKEGSSSYGDAGAGRRAPASGR